jgi:hypothetical protein
LIDLRMYGYRSRRAFHADRAVREGLFEDMAFDPRWPVQKSALTHPDCPDRVKDVFRCDDEWYKRFVAYFSNGGYRWREALADPSPVVRACAVRWYESRTIAGRIRRFLREGRFLGRRHEARGLQQGQADRRRT